MKIIEGKIRFDKMITINLKKYLREVYPAYFEESLKTKYEIWKDDKAGIFDWTLNKIVLIHSKFMKKLAKKHGGLEKQICRTISHETMHKVLLDQFNWKVSAQFDNIAEELEDYMLW